MTSALTGDGVADLRRWLAARVPEGPWHYPEDQVSDAPMRQLAAEITREKLYARLHQELPYQSTVETDIWKELRDGAVRIEQTIYVERDSQRKIVLGKGGATIKAIGADARREIAVAHRAAGASVPVREGARGLERRSRSGIARWGSSFPRSDRHASCWLSVAAHRCGHRGCRPARSWRRAASRGRSSSPTRRRWSRRRGPRPSTSRIRWRCSPLCSAACRSRVTVYPTENYYYFKFVHAGVPIAGNLRLDPRDRDKGKVYFGYYEDNAEWKKDGFEQALELDGSAQRAGRAGGESALPHHLSGNERAVRAQRRVADQAAGRRDRARRALDRTGLRRVGGAVLPGLQFKGQGVSLHPRRNRAGARPARAVAAQRPDPGRQAHRLRLLPRPSARSQNPDRRVRAERAAEQLFRRTVRPVAGQFHRRRERCGRRSSTATRASKARSTGWVIFRRRIPVTPSVPICSTGTRTICCRSIAAPPTGGSRRRPIIAAS